MAQNSKELREQFQTSRQLMSKADEFLAEALLAILGILEELRNQVVYSPIVATRLGRTDANTRRQHGKP